MSIEGNQADDSQKSARLLDEFMRSHAAEVYHRARCDALTCAAGIDWEMPASAERRRDERRQSSDRRNSSQHAPAADGRHLPERRRAERRRGLDRRWGA